MDDAELVRQTLAGRTEAFADLACRWSARITAICHARVRRADVADDLAQEALLRGFRALHTLSDPAKVGAWLMGIAARAALDWLKAKERTTRSFSALNGDESIEFGSAELPPDGLAFQADERRRILVAVEALPDPLRQAIMLYYYDDLSYRDLAALLGVSTATINARLTRARELLRERLTEHKALMPEAPTP
jgi:RNA polymerase sigma factor (sigma-70 family)